MMLRYWPLRLAMTPSAFSLTFDSWSACEFHATTSSLSGASGRSASIVKGAAASLARPGAGRASQPATINKASDGRLLDHK